MTPIPEAVEDAITQLEARRFAHLRARDHAEGTGQNSVASRATASQRRGTTFGHDACVCPRKGSCRRKPSGLRDGAVVPQADR